jgi:hypothetical protein
VSARVLVELCAGTASVSLRALTGRPFQPLVGFMGSKRRWATEIAEHLGFATEPPDRVVLVDGGPWGDVWDVLRRPEDRRMVAAQLHAWSDQEPRALWDRLTADGPPADSPRWRVAQYLAIQNGAPSSVPVWWDGQRWSQEGRNWNKDRSRVWGAEVRKACFSALRIGSLVRVARAVGALDVVPWDRVEVVRADVREVEPIAGAAVFFDPPYENRTRYAALCPRADVLRVSSRWADAGCRVLVAEAVPLPLPGWSSVQLAADEWLTASWPLRVAQPPLFGAA